MELMKITIIKKIKRVIDRLLKEEKNNNLNFPTKKFPFHSLSPIQNADADNSYFDALKWAIENRKNEDIKNIAIAGPFGSGKSSVLKTFEKKNTNHNIHILNISLANFKNGESEGNDKQNSDLPRLIELSILQQIFYHEKDCKIPDSRFRKIRSFKTKDIFIKTISALIFLFACVNIYFQNILIDVSKKTGLTFPEKNWITIICVAIILVGVSIIIYNSVRIINSLQVSKFKIKDTEIEVDKSVNKSILNHHLDEILYFFEVTNYNVVVIEDLDRFGQTEIFTKLREINLLINNSKNIDKDVVFIYAIRDDMFLDEERTKFFDFVIPIIPVINSSNSNEILLEKKKKNNFEISDSLIENISLFIEDMRILHNIINEYSIYHSKLDKRLDQNKLLSMLVYKNLFPNDFIKLSKNEGVLFKTLSEKKTYIKLETNKIEDQIKEKEREIKELETIKISDVRELRAIYLFHYMTKALYIQYFETNNGSILPISMLEDDNFNYLAEDKVTHLIIQRPNYNYSQRIDSPITFDSINKEVNNTESYFDRAEKIYKWHKNHVNKLRKEIEALENKKQDAKSVAIRKLIKPLNNEVDSVCKQEVLINVLLRNGYINEDYLDYITIFYEGSLSKQDHQFLLNIKAQLASDFDYNLIKIDKLISKINPTDFKEPYILNYKLVNHILTDKKLVTLRVNIFEQLSNESKKSIGFIDGYIQNVSNISLFIENICKYWVNIWNYISEFSNYTKEKKEKYLKLILRYAQINDLVEIANFSELKQLIARKADFADFIGDDERVKVIIEKLDIRFERLDVSKTSKEIINLIYTGFYFDFNKEILKVLINEIGKLDDTSFNVSNYHSIKSSGCTELFDYIYIHINAYIEDVYLAISTNINEVEESYIELLRNKELSVENIEKLVERIETKISDVSLLENDNIANIVLKHSKVVPTWGNVIFYFENNGTQMSTTLLQFLNRESNYTALAYYKIPIDNEEREENRYKPFVLSLVKQDEITNISFDYLLKSVPYVFKKLTFENLSFEKVELLVKNQKLGLTKDNYKALKETYKDLHIRLVSNYRSKFIQTINDYEIDQDDFNLIISSKKFSSEEKNLILNSVDESIVLSSSNTLGKIGDLIIESSAFTISATILKKVLLTNSISEKQRLKIFALKQSQLDSTLITDFLNSLAEPFTEISIRGKNPLLIYNTENLKLAEILDTVDYISKFKIEDKGIRIYTFKKQIE